ncbi:MAG: penicillin-binding protein 2 [Pseudomonadota bacterium]
MRYSLKDLSQLFSRRVMLLGAAQSTLFATLGARMWWLQIEENKKYFDLAEGNRIDVRFLLPQRGRILTDDLLPIANIIPKFEIVLIPYRVRELKPTLEKLSEITTLHPDKITELQEMNKHLFRYAFVPIKTIHDWNEATKVSNRLYELPGIDMHVGHERHYPFPDLFSHISGYVASVSKRDQKEDASPMLKIPGMKIGKQGIEKTSDKTLRGQAGSLKVEVNHLGRVQKELDRVNPVSGKDLHLTVNGEIQRAAIEAIGSESGATVVMNVKNGAVLAMCSTPAYNPNLFINGISHKDWNNIRNNERAPMNNKAIIGQYPPGSTFKMLTLIAGLEMGYVTPDEKIYCPGHYRLGKGKFHCWKYSGHGYVNAVQAIMWSCDVYFYELSQRVGIEKIAEVARRYGLGTDTGIELPFEKAGLMPDPAWKMDRYGQRWLKGETVITSIGQGSVLTTPLQLAVMTARLATDRKVMPHMIQTDDRPPFDYIAEANPDITNIIREGMFSVVNRPGGTASAGKIQSEYGQAAGKTGTAQVRRISKSERRRGVLKNHQLQWKYRDHALYVAFAPYDDPIYAVSTVIEHGGSGSRAAAPVATAALRKTFEVYGLNQDAPYVTKTLFS